MSITADYVERVYAGVLGKIIGVYLGRPFEGWSYERIVDELGEINYYVNDLVGKPLIVTDDDISGTFTFLRSLPDHDNRREISAAEIGKTWLNYIIEQRTILWWGGMGNSTEHTAYLRLKEGIPAPRSGSIKLNGKTVAEQIGAEIFIDGWAMVAPGDPELASELARKAASVSHDGEAVHAAQLLAAMEAVAFVEHDIGKLLDEGLRFAPRGSTISRVVEDVRSWHAGEKDWRKTRLRIVEKYGYGKYPGHVHVVPNHALIILSLLYGEDNLQKSLMIANTSGWDTDCNSGNVACLLGIKNGLGCFEEGPDWRGPIADRMYLSTADGGRAITDAAREALEIVATGRALAGEKPLRKPKNGARFHFELPGSVQGFSIEQLPQLGGNGVVENVVGHSERGTRSLAIRYRAVAPGSAIRATTPTFIPPDAIHMGGYALIASPTLYPGETLHLRVEADSRNTGRISARPIVRIYDSDDRLSTRFGPATDLGPGTSAVIDWLVDHTGGQPIAAVGIEISASERASGSVYLDYLSWDGTPAVAFARPGSGGTMWRRAWVDATDHFDVRWPEAFSISHDRGTGLLSTGADDWRDYEVAATLSVDLAKEFGIAARVSGLLRYYALLLTDEQSVVLVKQRDDRTILASAPFPWDLGVRYRFRLQVVGNRISAWIDDNAVFEVVDGGEVLGCGGVGVVCGEGRAASDEIRVQPPSS